GRVPAPVRGSLGSRSAAAARAIPLLHHAAVRPRVFLLRGTWRAAPAYVCLLRRCGRARAVAGLAARSDRDGGVLLRLRDDVRIRAHGVPLRPAERLVALRRGPAGARAPRVGAAAETTRSASAVRGHRDRA